MDKTCSDAELQNLSKEELIGKIKSLQAYNIQLKNIIAKSQETEKHEDFKNQQPFDFTKCYKRHILLKFFYLGWDYKGFVTQEDTTNTIEYHIFRALTRTCLIKDRSSSNYHRCGRTDKGVSSFGQVISLDVRSKLAKKDQHILRDEINYCSVLNKVLPDNIQCVAWAPVHENFSARFDCSSRTYKYFFPKGSLDIEEMKNASKLLLGTHDFRNFCKMDVGNGVVQFIRNIFSITIEPVDAENDAFEYSMFCMTIVGQAYLWHQIRCIMGILFLIGQKKEKPELIAQLLDVFTNPRKPDYQMANEIPLNLFYCDFPNIMWLYNDNSLSIVIQKLREMWTISAIKETMIYDMLTNLESQLNNSEKNKSCLSNALLQGTKTKKYVPVMKRKLCNSLEEKIESFAKRNRIDITSHMEDTSN